MDLQAVDILANKLLEEGIVKPSYIPAVKKREIEFCTGLQFEDMGIANPSHRCGARQYRCNRYWNTEESYHVQIYGYAGYSSIG